MADLDEKRINPFILEAQNCDLKPVLNPALYLDFIKKMQTPADPDYTKYNELLIGKEYTIDSYTIQFEGVRPMLAYYALARFAANNPLHVTRTGIVSKNISESERAEASTLRAFINELRSAALGYQIEVIKFLDQKISDYPLYNYNRSAGSAVTTSFNFFKL